MGDVNITIVDGGTTVQVPSASLQVVIGTAIAGTNAAIVATKNPVTLASTFTAGPLLQAATLAVLAGGTVLAIKAATISTGTASAVTFTGTGTSVLTLTLDGTHGAYDTTLARFKVVSGGTIGTTGITFQLSLDAGRNYGVVLSLGTAVSYTIPNLGVTINFAAGTLVAGDIATFSTVAPETNAASIQACLNSLQASQYASAGWGSMHVTGTYTGANASTLDGYMSTLATGYIFSRMVISARDAAIPVAYGGAGETEAAWTAAVAADFSAVSAKRVAACAGNYNVTGIANAAAGSPAYRRPLSWLLAARMVQIPPQRHAGRVLDGAIQAIVNPTSDPTDGFIYHDERMNVGITAARLIAARTFVGKQGFFIDQPNLLSPSGSRFNIMPYGNVMDVACGIAHQVGLNEINSDIRLNTNGTIYELEAKRIERAVMDALDAQMISTAEISSATVTVDRTNNVSTTSAVNIAIAIYARGYVLNENITIGFAS